MAEIHVGTQFESEKPQRQDARTSEGLGDRGPDKIRVLHIGDFGLADGAEISVCNRSTFADTLGQMSPQVRTGLTDSDGAAIDLSIRSLDDFHPDELFDKAPSFARLRQLRRQLNIPSKSDEAAREIGNWLRPATETESTGTPSDSTSTNSAAESNSAPESNATDTNRLDTSNLFDSVLSTTAAEAGKDLGPWANLISEVVDSSRIHTITQSVKDAESLLDVAMAHLMRRILWAPRFREIEACWRGLDFLVRRADSGMVEFGILQLSRARFVELSAASESQRLAKQIGFGEEVPGKQPWTIALPTYIDLDDSELLSGVNALARSGGGAATKIMCGLSATSPEEATGLAESEQWVALQAQPTSAGIHSACPGFLLRLPYGDKQGRVESFEFEELPAHDISKLSWGSGALLTCFALIKNFEQGVATESAQTAEGLPLHVYHEHGAAQLHPTCRFQLTQATAGQLRTLGVSPVIGYHEDDKAQIPGIFNVRGTPLQV
jgi:type VI secretion system protein ImpC